MLRNHNNPAEISYMEVQSEDLKVWIKIYRLGFMLATAGWISATAGFVMAVRLLGWV